jgi:hypothetical protein
MGVSDATSGFNDSCCCHATNNKIPYTHARTPQHTSRLMPPNSTPPQSISLHSNPYHYNPIHITQLHPTSSIHSPTTTPTLSLYFTQSLTQSLTLPHPGISLHGLGGSGCCKNMSPVTTQYVSSSFFSFRSLTLLLYCFVVRHHKIYFPRLF